MQNAVAESLYSPVRVQEPAIAEGFGASQQEGAAVSETELSFERPPVTSLAAEEISIQPAIEINAVVIRARMAGFDESLEEASRDLGANQWQTFWNVTLPYMVPGVVAGALLAFTLSLDDFVITFFTSGPGSTTFPLKIYSMVRFSVTPEVNAASTVLIVLTLTLTVAALAIQGRSGKHMAAK